MFNASSSRYLLVRVFYKYTITNKGIILPVFIVVNREYHGIIFAFIFGQLMLIELTQLKINFPKMNFLFHAGYEIEILDIVDLIRCIKHGWYIHLILLFSYAGGHPDVAVDFGVHFESDLKLITRRNILKIRFQRVLTVFKVSVCI